MKRIRRGMECQECGSDCRDSGFQDESGKVWHFRKIIQDGQPHPIHCYGKFARPARKRGKPAPSRKE